MYRIEVLIATMFKENESEIINLLNNMNIHSDCVVVSQCNKNGIENYFFKDYKVTCIFSTERGLSRSRNLALQYATADIVILADDDVRYNDDYPEIVSTAYLNHPSYDVLTFKVRNDKKYSFKEIKLNRLLIHKVTSYEITMKLSFVKDISFNVLFGAGSSYFQCGEENIYLDSCIRKKKSIMYIPQKIACLPENGRPSTWFTGYNKDLMISKGAVFYELSHLLVYLYILQFAIRKYLLYKKEINIFAAIYYMILGVNKYKRILNNNIKNNGI
jgi:glycosyltransferase involved in cell wall biosynthesis